MNKMAKAATFHLFANDFPFLSSQKNLLRTHNIFFYTYYSAPIAVTPASNSFSHSALLIAISFPFIQWTRSDPNYFLVDFCPTENNYCIYLDLRLTKYTFSTKGKRRKKKVRKKKMYLSFGSDFFFCFILILLFFQWDSTWTVIDFERLNLSYSRSILVADVVVGFRLTLELRPKNDWNWMAFESTTGKRC